MAHAVPERKPDGKGALTSGSGQTRAVGYGDVMG
jgi:hypothetical protein